MKIEKSGDSRASYKPYPSPLKAEENTSRERYKSALSISKAQEAKSF